ncbi:hypothetical protein Q3G72_017954 [Acer saccharum]|nr:hypothetical protein Q3G72_017954 [Acer saccharum]
MESSSYFAWRVPLQAALCLQVDFCDFQVAVFGRRCNPVAFTSFFCDFLLADSGCRSLLRFPSRNLISQFYSSRFCDLDSETSSHRIPSVNSMSSSCDFLLTVFGRRSRK